MVRKSKAKSKAAKNKQEPLQQVKEVSDVESIDLQEEQASSQKSFVSNFDDEDSKYESIEIESVHSEEDDYKVDEDELKEMLKHKTNYYMLTYSEIKSELDFSKYPLTKFTDEHVKNVIRYERAKIKNERKEQIKADKQNNKINMLQKRSNAQRQEPLQEKKVQKRCKVEDLPSHDHCNYEMARFFVNNINEYGDDISNKIFKHIDGYIKSNDELSTKTQELMIKKYQQEAIALYDKRDFRSLTNLLSSMSNTNAILVNIQISMVNQNYSEESNTLQETLLIHLNNTYDYSFLTQDATYTMGRFVKALTNHIIDTSCQVQMGFIICSLKYEPSRLRKVISHQKNQTSLRDALLKLNYPQSLTEQITKHYQHLLWPDLLDHLKSMTEKTANDCIQIVLKLTLLSDPGSYIRSLADIFAQRQLLADELLKAQTILIGIQPLIRVLEILLPLSKESIISVLSKDSTEWESQSQKNSNKVEIEELNKQQPDYQELYRSFTNKLEHPIDYQAMISISKEVSETTQYYKHCEYQSSVASVLASYKQPFVIVIVPTGSGKTWIQGLLAKYSCIQGEQVTILEPNEQLKVQTAEKLGVVDYGINIMTVDDFYLYGTKDEIVILDEYDIVINDMPYYANENLLSGLWKLKDKRVYAFTATSSICHERLVNNCINKPTVLNFKSEYELLYGISPIQEPKIVDCKNEEMLFSIVEQNLDSYYDQKPIIIIYSEEQFDGIQKLITANKFRIAKDSSESTLMKIKSWDRGILMLEKGSSRGLDTRFQVDSIVFILCEASNYSELMQMIGRSSRQRNACESIYYTFNHESSSQLMARLKKNGMDELQNMERLMQLLEKRAREPSLIQVLNEAHKKKEHVKSIADLQRLMLPSSFNKLMKNIQL